MLFDDIEKHQKEQVMNIVILDALAANPGDISWDPFSRYGNVTAYDVTPPGLVAERARDCEICITNKTRFDADVISQLPKLKYIGVLATGYNVVDLDACAARGIVVTNVPEYGTFATAQMTIALLLELCDRVGLHSSSVMNGDWCKAPQFSYFLSPLTELAGKRLHIIGFGKIGRRVAAIASALGMTVTATPHSLTSSKELCDGYEVALLTLEKGLSEADVVTLHCPLTAATSELINARTLAMMHDGALLINCSRGGVINEQDVADALRNGRLGGFGADVVATEPMLPDNPLLGAPNAFITPHIAWAPVETRRRLIDAAAANLGSFLEGRPVNMVN